jgi:hypothetical protein
MSYQQVRRRRRRRVLVGLVGLVVILAVAYAVTRVQSERQVRREYLDQALQFADSQADLADRFADLVERLEEIGRPGMVAILDEIQEGTATLARELEAVGAPPGGLGSGDLYLEIAAGRWRDGITHLRQGLLALSAEALDERGMALLWQGLIDLRVGDSAFAGFLGILEDVDTSDLGRDFPVVAFVPGTAEARYDADDLARRLLLTPGLAVLENLSVADLRLDPAPVGEQVGLPVVPISDSLDVEVTVANRGTVRGVAVPVILELLSQDGSIFRDEESIALLEPGALTTVQFPGLPVEPGKLYEIIVSLGGGDDDPSDDSVSFTFIRNAEG